jgi:hypothetical protein
MSGRQQRSHSACLRANTPSHFLLPLHSNKKCSHVTTPRITLLSPSKMQFDFSQTVWHSPFPTKEGVSSRLADAKRANPELSNASVIVFTVDHQTRNWRCWFHKHQSLKVSRPTSTVMQLRAFRVTYSKQLAGNPPNRSQQG